MHEVKDTQRAKVRIGYDGKVHKTFRGHQAQARFENEVRVLKFLEEGDKVKVTLRFRGREMAHQELGLELLNRVAGDVGDKGKIESMPRLEGRQMVMMVAPR